MVLPDAAGWPFEGGVTLPANVEMGQMWHIQTGSAKLASKIFASEVASKCPGPICSAGSFAGTPDSEHVSPVNVQQKALTRQVNEQPGAAAIRRLVYMG
ncbi:hypothetical protein WJX79_006199 [Trebouxia sp. C0005]